VSPGREDFCGASWHLGAAGLPLIDGAIATLECTVVETFNAGDHDLFIGRVDTLEQADASSVPLLYYRAATCTSTRAPPKWRQPSGSIARDVDHPRRRPEIRFEQLALARTRRTARKTGR
jgi:flavin reductase (DIM6/NTAB) family NADH-FMN oxidoreductase RutF